MVLLFACAAPASAPVPAPREIKIMLPGTAFVPSDITVQPGERIRLVLEGKELPHTFVVEGLEHLIEIAVDKEQTVTRDITIPAGVEGTFTLYCGPHRVSGMVGTFTVGKPSLEPHLEVYLYTGGPELILPLVITDKPGWVVIHPVATGRAVTARDLGRVQIEPGVHRNVRVPLTTLPVSEEPLHAILHYDNPADGQFTDASGKPDDPPVYQTLPVRDKGLRVGKQTLVRLPTPVPTPKP
ncbi:MAG: cupredoxin domain-containing protein [Chloroflexi bacterium]|nr:cupredoxin domain-containing protein [Chloroflexota bacterium]